MTAEQENPVSFFRFEDLRIYAKALDYVQWLYEATSTLQTQQSINIAEALIKSAQSIALNVAEGSARNKAQFVYYLKMAKSSIRECVVYTEIASKMSVLNDEAREYSRTQLMELTKMIGSLVASLQRSTSNSRDEDPD
ncbi:MAG TPA: four helix bundle protein [Bacteroidales bacterium]|jgi:four helix bundle protein|nr:four helix bundle protein [Bacteroidales bacterium]HPY81264.1 four helix bundle protein [Bacteroidales bacterium]HXK74235.1 four helix bundle protein [Bacteroidales bacterium]